MNDEFDLAPPPDDAVTLETSPDIFSSREAGVKWFDSLVNGAQSQEVNPDENAQSLETQSDSLLREETPTEIQEKIDIDAEVSLEADYVGNLTELDSIVTSMESDGGIDKYTAQRLDLLTGGALAKRVPINSFTRDKSKTNLTVSMEVSDMARYAMYGIAGAALLGAGYLLLKRQVEMAKDPRNQQAVTIIKEGSTLRTARTDYTKDVRRMTSHIQSGALRNKELLEALERNAKRRLSSVQFSESDPNKFGEQLVDGIWQYKISKVWTPMMHKITHDSTMSQTITNLSDSYVAASRSLHDKFRKLKADFKLQQELVLDDYKIDYASYGIVSDKLGLDNLEGRISAIKVNAEINKLIEHDPGLKIPVIDRVLTIYLDTSVMNRLDADAFNLATRINVLYTDMQTFATKYMETSEFKANRIHILDELEKDMRTITATYAALINVRNDARRLVENVRSAINESRGLWQAIDRDQTGKL